MSISQKKSINAPEVTIRSLREHELETADRIFRLAFGTFLGMPNPEMFAGDSDAVRTRWKADPTRVFAAEVDGELVGTNVASNWGSVGFFGPLTIRPDLWDRGIAQRLMEPVMEKFSEWGTRHAGLFTFPHSTKHLYLYQKYGFYPRFLTALLSKPVNASISAINLSTLSEVSKSEQAAVLRACSEVTEAIYEGLNVHSEIQAIQEKGLARSYCSGVVHISSASHVATVEQERKPGLAPATSNSVLFSQGLTQQSVLTNSYRRVRSWLLPEAYPIWWQGSI